MKIFRLMDAVCASLLGLVTFASIAQSAQIYTEIDQYDGYRDYIAGYGVDTNNYKTALLHQDSTDGLPSGATYDSYGEVRAEYGSLHSYLSVDVNNYLPSTYTYFDEDLLFYDTYNAGYTSAQFRDTFSVESPTGGYLNFIFDFDGVISSTSTIDDMARTSVLFQALGRDPDIPEGQGYYWQENYGTYSYISSTVVNTTIEFNVPFEPGTSKDILFNLQSWIAFEDGGLTNPYSAAATIDFLNTASLSAILITDEFGNAIPEVSLLSESGTSYQLSTLNTIPIPSAAWLFGSGLIGLIGMARRKKA